MSSDILVNFSSLFLVMGAFQGVLFSLLLIFRKHQRRSINFHLSVMLLALSIEILHVFMVKSGYINNLKSLAGFALPFDGIIAISLYWYVRTITFPEKNNSIKTVLFHYIPFFLYILLSIPFWRLPFSQKFEFLSSGVLSSEWPAPVYYALMLQSVLKIIFFLIYLTLSIKLLSNHKKRIGEVFSYKENITLNWLSNLLWLFLIGAAQGMITLVFFQENPESIQVAGSLEIFTILAILYIGIMGLLQPKVYKQSEKSYLKSIASIKSKHQSAKEKYRKSALSNDDMKRISEKIEHIMKNESLFLNSALTLPKLADNLGISPHYLSQTFNTIFNVTFFDYINAYRIDYAKKQLNKKSNLNRSITEIAADSAFNSRSAFYSAFKKNVGMTPTQYKEIAKQ